MTKSTTVSAPGKILFAGGYLVLESPNVGYVVAADKRFYTTIETKDDSNDCTEEDNKNTFVVVVRSPQFHSTWTYNCSIITNNNDDSKPSISLVASGENESKNPFVEKTLRVMLAFVLHQQQATFSKNASLVNITIQADNDFYSVIPHLQGKPRTPENVMALEKFLNCPRDETTGKAIVNKTGLGSSAALTTSLVGAIYEHFLEKDKMDKQEIHNLAQICHCYAQGKVGSGFDVSSAMNGSHVYQRFPKCLLPDLLQNLASCEEDHGGQVTSSTAELLSTVVQKTWSDNMATPLPIPQGLQVLLADVCGGSESPSMARKVLAWKQQEKANTAATTIPHWDDLKQLNQTVVDLMQNLANETIDTELLAKHTVEEWKTLQDKSTSTDLLIQLCTTFSKCRQHLREMGEAASVPIEPPEQTKLCDETMKLPGVITTLVPGAGGYDAVACLYIDTPEVKKSIGDLWANWNENSQIICPLSVQATHQGLQLE